MIAIDSQGRIAGGTSTNGATHKVPGYVELYKWSHILIDSGSKLCLSVYILFFTIFFLFTLNTY